MREDLREIIKTSSLCHPLVSSSLVKMLYWMCEKSGLPPTGPQLKHAICRNFGGMESDELDTLEEFQRCIPIRDPPDLQSIPEKV